MKIEVEDRRSPEEKLLDKYLDKIEEFGTCNRCQRRHYGHFMLLDELWKIIATKGYRVVCIFCAEVVLGREIDLPDFKEDVPLNETIIWALKKRKPG